MTGSQARHALSHLAPFEELVRFAKALEEEHGDDFDIYYFLEKPWKWADEYVRWVAAGRPTDPGWDMRPVYPQLRCLIPGAVATMANTSSSSKDYDFGYSVRVTAEQLAHAAFEPDDHRGEA